jgi:hypothetical protein
MKNNCIDGCKFRNYETKSCDKNPGGFTLFMVENGKKKYDVDVLPEMGCYEKSDLTKTYYSLMEKLNQLGELIDKKNEI